jgi:hypothetical protein
LLSPEEKEQTKHLAILARRDKKLAELLMTRRMMPPEPGMRTRYYEIEVHIL